MVKKLFRKANSLLLAAAMTATMIPAQMISAAGPENMSDTGIMQQVGDTLSSDVNITVIKGNTPIFPQKVNSSADDGTMVNVTWAEWEDVSADNGTYKVNGTTDDGRKVEATVNVLPCDEVVPDVHAIGRKLDDGGTEQDQLDAIHPLKGYKGQFVTEYDIVFDDVRSTHDRAVIYLPEAMNDGTALTAGNCWDTGARLQFKFSHKDKWYFQTQNGDGQNKDNAVYFPMKDDELKNALNAGQKVDRLLEFDENEIYHVRTVMDTATDTTKGNVKIYITDPEGIEHEVTKEGGNGFRIYPKDGIIEKFAAVRGGYTLTNHKVSWISGYATKKVETYLKAEDATVYTKENSDTTTKEIPERMAEHQPDTNIVRNNQSYVLDAEMSGWYDGDSKVTSLNAAAGGTYTYRAYYQFENVDKGDLSGKIEDADKLDGNDYTASSWKIFSDALTEAKEVNGDTSASQEAVNDAARKLGTAQENLVSIKSLKEAISNFEEGLPEETQKDNYANWDEVQKALEDAKDVLAKSDATKDEIEAAENSLKDLELVTKAEAELKAAKKEMDDAVEAAEEKLKEIKEADYTPASWQALQDALTSCKNLNPETANKNDYDTKKKALNDALENLAKKADKTALNQAIVEAEAKKEADYESGYKEMQQALATAKTVAGNANATQTEVDTAKTDLQNAVKNLKSKTVRQPQPVEVKVNSIKPAAKTYKIAINKKLDLKKVFTALPENAANRNMTYSIDSKYSKYASINKSGVITVKKAGAGKTVVVKATAADGSNTSATIKIKIMKNAVTKITVKKKSLTVKAGKKVTIKPTVRTNGKKVNKTLEYTSSNEKIATVNKKGVVTTKKGKTGKVTITIKSTDGTNKSAKVKITIKK